MQSASRSYWTAWSATLLFFAGFYALLVPLPRYLIGIGLPDWQVGLILGAFGVVSVVGRPLTGPAVDRWGARVVLLAGAGSLLVGATAVTWTADPWLLGLLRVFHALGYVAFTTAGTALVIQLTPEGQRGSRLAIFGAAANVAITATPAATTWLLEVAPLWTGFAASAGLAAVAGAMALTIHSPDRASAGNVAVASWRVGRNVLLSMLAAGLFGLVFAAFFLFAPILSERRAVPPGALYTVYGVGIILTRFVAGPWLDRLGVARTLLISLAPIVSGLLLAGFGHDVMVLGLAAFLLAVGGGLFHPALLAHHARLMPDTPGRATAAFYLGFDLGIGLGSWLLGFVLDGFGLTALYLVAAVLALAALPLVRVIARRS